MIRYIDSITLRSINDPTPGHSCSFDVSYRDGSKGILHGEFDVIDLPLDEGARYAAQNPERGWACDVCVYDAPGISAHDLQHMSELVLAAYLG